MSSETDVKLESSSLPPLTTVKAVVRPAPKATTAPASPVKLKQPKKPLFFSNTDTLDRVLNHQAAAQGAKIAGLKADQKQRARITVREIPRYAYKELLTRASCEDDDYLDFMDRDHSDAILEFDPKDQVGEAGTFKIAIRARLLLPGGRTEDVVLKMFKNEKLRVVSPTLRGITRDKERELYVGECSAMLWAFALQDLANEHGVDLLDKIDVPKGKRLALQPLDVPVFVDAWCGQLLDWQDKAYFVLERMIEWKGKYINNNGLYIPQALADADMVQRLAYFVFCQHTLFLVTEGRCFISDYQGGLKLLSDPQIISKGVKCFAGGNYHSALKNFKDEHACSAYCHVAGYNKLNAFTYDDVQDRILNLPVLVGEKYAYAVAQKEKETTTALAGKWAQLLPHKRNGR